MSAFVIDESVMHKVVRAIAQHRTVFGPAVTRSCAGLDEIGRALFAMNIDAVTQRYPDCKANPINLPGTVGCEKFPATYRFSDNHLPMTKKDRIDSYKAIQCLLYQCSEGNVPETTLFIELTNLGHDLASAIVSGLPEYEAAPWGE